MQHGFGKETLEGGNVKYEGGFVQSKKEGKGRFDWKDGSYYEGEVQDNQFCGSGIYHMSESNRTYEGAFVANQFDGKGKLMYNDGFVYFGDWRAGKKEG